MVLALLTGSFYLIYGLCLVYCVERLYFVLLSLTITHLTLYDYQ